VPLARRAQGPCGYVACRDNRMAHTPRSKRPGTGLPPAGKPPQAAQGRGLTVHSRGGLPGPRLPRERDESSDSQSTTDPESVAVGIQAHEDVTRGLVDTDRGPVLDAVYNGQASPTPGVAQESPPEPPGGAARGALGRGRIGGDR
jgi:hypothetical protein